MRAALVGILSKLNNNQAIASIAYPCPELLPVYRRVLLSDERPRLRGETDRQLRFIAGCAYVGFRRERSRPVLFFLSLFRLILF